MKDFGIFLIDKPIGLSSFGVIRQLRKITGIKKMGHTGTLDPFASGVLPILFGKATRLSNEFLSQEKEYLVRMKFGEKSTTGDIEGEIIERSNVIPEDVSEIQNLKDEIVNISEQVPPAFSAIKINGKKAYQLAREGKEVKLQSRPIKIFDFEILDYNAPYLEYRVLVSKGTYIRRLSEQIAELLDSVALTDQLRRLSSGFLKIDQTTKLAEVNKENWRDKVASISEILGNSYVIVQLKEDDIERFRHGMAVEVDEPDNSVMLVDIDNDCIGFGLISEGKLKPKMVLI